MAKIAYKIVTPYKLVASGEADSLSVMTVLGEITVLPNHVPLLALMKAGELRINHGGQEELLATSTGLFEVRQGGEVVVLADSAEHSDELELEAIEEAKHRAQQALAAARNRNDVAYTDLTAHLERELARYKVAMKRSHRKKRA